MRLVLDQSLLKGGALAVDVDEVLSSLQSDYAPLQGPQAREVVQDGARRDVKAGQDVELVVVSSQDDLEDQRSVVQHTRHAVLSTHHHDDGTQRRLGASRLGASRLGASRLGASRRRR
eukprot:357640-Chlamydomonas_euryale.AAC.3